MLTLKDFLAEGPHDPARRKAIFLAGGPGSGKSYVASRTAHGLGFKHINSDDAFEKSMRRHGMAATPENIYSDKGQELRNKAKETTEKLQHQYAKQGLGMVIDGTGKDPEKIKKHSERLRKMGYDTHMVIVNTSLEVAKKRNKARDRSLPDKEVEKMHQQVQSNIGHFQNHFGAEHTHIVDNDRADENHLLGVHKQIRKIANAPLRNTMQT
jgi:predicted kinase